MADIELVIKIPEETYIHLRNSGNIGASLLIENAIKNGTPIPDNDCNNCEKAWTDKCERAECYENNYKHWTPYQKGSKE